MTVLYLLCKSLHLERLSLYWDGALIPQASYTN